VVETAAGRHDGDVVGRQPDVGVGAAVIILDVWLEVVGVGDRSEAWFQRGEGSDSHIIAVVSDLGSSLVLCGGHGLRSGLSILVRDQTLRVDVVRLILGMSPVLDVVAFTIFTLHDAIDSARGTVLVIIVQATVGEFSKTRHPRNVEFNKVLEACFSGAGNSRLSESWNL
jgi:hypothetical protein